MKPVLSEPSPFETEKDASPVGEATAVPAAPRAKAHITILDGLRGIAALSVCLFHYTTGALSTFRHPIMQFVGHRGYLGVEIFFVISGFIIPFALARSNYSLKKFGQFMVRRFVRIGPPAYLTMVIFAGVCFLVDYFHLTASPFSKPITVPMLVHNLLFTIPFTTYQWINGIFWTLSIEFEFYLVLGLLFPLLRKYSWGIMALGLALSASYYIPGMPEQTLFHYNVLFTFGMATWLMFDKLISRNYFFAVLALFSVIGVFQVTSAPVLAGVATALAIIYLRFSNPVATFFGNISYSLYLLHIIVGATMELLLIRLIPVVNLATVVLALIVCIGTAVGISYLFYRYVETPCMRLSGQLFRAKRA
ncbi:acyltransferase family protein [Hymenobacter negativus]|uniref:Acyltransferase n=1 Tax=Hymenobacter negativus TaxID=2795026 RepID=A0ABS3Q9S1_9BACT|nr:acyltransferase [Hymenobacter negativus]MBO2007465.1 acyltransferase [Hymenobacter negativus]